MSRATLQEGLTAAIDRRLSQIHTCLPGKIEKYDFETQKASVLPLIKKKYLDDKVESMPVIVNVPVMFPRSKDFSFTFPIKEGDTVLLLFCERSMELWLEQGGEQEPGDRRKFDLTDCIAIPGLYPFSEVSKAENNDDVLMVFKESKLRITKEGKFQIKGNVEIDGKLTIKAGNDLIVEDGDVLAGEDEISLTSHTHSGVEPGGGNSGPPNT